MSRAGLSDAERLDWLRLIRSERVGPRTFRALVAQLGSARGALDALPDLARRAGRGRVKIPTAGEAEREFEALHRAGGRFVASADSDYPKALLAIDTAPPLLAVRGSAEALARPTVAIVGSRNASAAGGIFAERLGSELGQAGFVVVSGLARGIDTRAHAGALAAGTVAVLAGGHDRVYPSENRPLLDRIVAEGGAAVSEMPAGWEPRGRDFPRRNRIVSGLSYGVVVVEAARRSGSLITARFALEQGREVFAVPGSPLDPRAEGTNDLIRGGATLCASAEHVIAAIRPLLAGQRPMAAAEGAAGGGFGESRSLWDELDLDASEAAGDDPALGPALDSGSPDLGGEGARVLSLLGVTPISVDDLARAAGLPIQTIHLLLVELELAGRLQRHAGRTVSGLPPRH